MKISSPISTTSHHPSCRTGPLAAMSLAAAACCAIFSTLADADPLNPLDFPSLGTLTLPAGTYTLNTAGTPTLIGPGTNIVGAVSPTDIAVFAFDSLTVPSGVTITVSGGTGSRPVALLTRGNLVFEGSLFANGAQGGAAGLYNGIGGIGGPGGSIGGGGGSPGDSGTFIGGDGSNGGGAGGGIGGNQNRNEGGGGSFGGGGFNYVPYIGWGQITGVQPNFHLSGGSGGGGCAGTGDSWPGQFRGGGGGGGGGGGAVEFGSLGALNLSGGLINANGGAGGTSVNIFIGGGGSGGAILLHGSTITLGAFIQANGGNGFGGGGGGRIAVQAAANPGTPFDVTGGNYQGEPGVISFAQVELSTTNLDCGSVPVGSSITVNMIVQNTGDAGSFINGQFPAAAAPFTRSATGIFSSLKQNAFTACPYTFTPAAIGPFSQTLSFLSNAGPVTVTISGNGECPADFNNDGSIDFFDYLDFVDAFSLGC